MSAFEVLSLDPAVPQIRAPGVGDTYSVPRDMTLASGTVLSAPTVDATNVEVTNVKAKDGTAAATIADSTGVVSITANPILSAGTANGVLYLNASKVATSGSALTFDGSNLGIGTSSPTRLLSLYNATAPVLQFTNSTTGTTANDGTLQYQSGANFIIEQQDSGYVSVLTGGSERLRLDSSGNLGLGVTPSAWNTYKAYQVGQGAAFWSNPSGTDLYISSNYVFDGAVKYIYTGYATYYSQNAGAHAWFTAPSGTAGNAITFTQAMTLDASGNLGVGETSPESRLHIKGATAVVKVENTSNTTYSGLELDRADDSTQLGIYAYDSSHPSLANAVDIYNYANGAIRFFTNSTERARITAGGYFKASNTGTYVGSTGAYHELRTTTNDAVTVEIRSAAANGNQYGAAITTANDQNDTTRYFLYCSGGGTERATIRSNGGLANYSANDVNLASDERLKKDIAPLGSTWGKVKDIEVVNFRYKDCNENDPALYGVIAQQVQPIVPELVVVTREATETEPEYYGIREQPMYWLAIKALQEAMTRIEQLEAKVAALEGA